MRAYELVEAKPLTDELDDEQVLVRHSVSGRRLLAPECEEREDTRALKRVRACCSASSASVTSARSRARNRRSAPVLSSFARRAGSEGESTKLKAKAACRRARASAVARTLGHLLNGAHGADASAQQARSRSGSRCFCLSVCGKAQLGTGSDRRRETTLAGNAARAASGQTLGRARRLRQHAARCPLSRTASRDDKRLCSTRGGGWGSSNCCPRPTS